MKILIVDVLEDKVVGLNKDGDFVNFKKDMEHEIGSEVEISIDLIMDTIDTSDEPSYLKKHLNFSKTSFRRITSIAAALIMALGVSASALSYYYPYSYVDIDINPSIELTANIFDKIIDIKGLNEDGKKILEGMKIETTVLEECISSVIDKAVSAGYLKDPENSEMLVSISSRSDDRAEKLQNISKDSIAKDIVRQKLKTGMGFEKFDIEKHVIARKLGISPGKYSLIQKLNEKEPSVMFDVYKELPVYVIMKRINQMRKDETKKDEISKDVYSKDVNSNDAIRKDEIRKDQIKKEGIRKDEIKKEEIRKDEIKKEQIWKDEEGKDEIRKDEVKKDAPSKDTPSKDEQRVNEKLDKGAVNPTTINDSGEKIKINNKTESGDSGRGGIPKDRAAIVKKSFAREERTERPKRAEENKKN